MKTNNSKYETIGRISSGRAAVRITELPIGCWTQNYKENVLKPMIEKQQIIDYQELVTYIVEKLRILTFI